MDRADGLRVFFSYSHKDERFLDQLRKHLANLEQEGLVRLWHDRAIRPGEEWEPAIAAQLDQADVIVLLISADFNASNFCRRVEMARAIERHRATAAVVIPVVVRQVEALPKEIAHLQAIPRDLKPIAGFQPQDEGYVQVARGIRRVLEEFVQQDRTDASSKRDVCDRDPRHGAVDRVLRVPRVRRRLHAGHSRWLRPGANNRVARACSPRQVRDVAAGRWR